MIISLRGTNGSGKSYVVRQVLAKASVGPIYGALGFRLPEAYRLRLTKNLGTPDTFVLGPYLNDCGGCDQMTNYDLIPQLITKYAPKGHVLFEGVIVASNYGRVGTLMEQWKQDSIFVLLKTPLEECLASVEGRRNRPRDERLIKNMKAKYDTNERIYERVKADGIMRAYKVSREDAPALVLKLLKQDQWNGTDTNRR